MQDKKDDIPLVTNGIGDMALPGIKEKSSLLYWQERWSKDPWNFATSWADPHARLLELAALKKYLRFDRPILELGCGNLQIAEDNDLLLSMAKAGYAGIDGSSAAIKVAQQRLSPFSSARVVEGDLTSSDVLGNIAEAWAHKDSFS